VLSGLYRPTQIQVMFSMPKTARYFRKNNTYPFNIPSSKSFWKQNNQVSVERGTTDLA